MFGANNTGDSGAGEIDVNVRSYFSDPDITLDGAVAQTLDKTGDGNLTFQLTQNSASARNLSILSTNSGSGTSTVTITAEDVVDIDASDANGKVHVENARFQENYIATTDATMHLDPGDDRAVTGLVRVWGDLQVDGVTTTVNSTTMTVDDVVLTLGGDTAPSADDNLDRGVEFRYYDSQARLGFYGWDTNYTDLGGHEGGYRFLHAATNTSETFTGTDSGIIAGNVKLTTNTNSTSNTTGDLVVAGGAGIGQDVNIGGLLDVDGTFRANSTSRFDDNIVLQGASKTLQLNNGAGTTKVELQSTTGNITGAGLATLNSLEVTTNADVLGNLGVTGTITGDVTGDLTGTADKADLVNITETATSNLTYYVPFVSANTGYTEVRTDSTNLTYNPFENRLTVTNFKSTTDFEVAGNLNVTGNITYNLSQVGSIANHTTDGLPEGTSNLYFTDERVDDRVGALISGGTGISATYDDAGNLLTLSAVQSDINTDSITEGSTNLFTTATRTRSHFTYGTGITLSAGELSVVQSDINTDNVTEGSTNVFFTDARARGAFSAGGDLSYNASTGEFSFTERTDAEVNGLADARIALNVGANLDLSSKDTDDLSEGISNQYFTDARARSAISASGDISYTANTGVISFTERTDAEVNSLADARIALAAGDYATAAQGTLADSAIQPADLATVATTGAYSDLTGTPSLATVATTGAYADLTGTPTLGTAAAAATTDFATAAQGTQADTNDTDIDDLYTALNDIGNDNTITTLAQLKTALANLSR